MTDHPIEALGPVPAPPTLLAAVLDAVGLTADHFVVRPSAIGAVLVVYNDRGVSACLVVSDRTIDEVAAEFRARFGRRCRLDPSPDGALSDAIDRVLAGGAAESLTFDLRSVSNFQRAVLDKAAEIPAGEVRPYGWVAAEIGRPDAGRAVGTALGRNPVPLLIPCHRVVRSDGRIGDYAFGSPAKRAILAAEGLDPDELERLASRGVRYLGYPSAGVFCHPTCGATRNRDDVVAFRSAGGAEAAGFAACPKCRPVPSSAAA